MIKQVHKPEDILANSKHNYYQIVLELADGQVGFWSGNGFDYLVDGFFKGKAIKPTELVSDYYRAVRTAEDFKNTGVIAIAALPSFN